jgi:hypothetical protein
MLGGGEFLGILLRLVAERGDVGVAVDGIAVEAQLGIEDLQAALSVTISGLISSISMSFSTKAL